MVNNQKYGELYKIGNDIPIFSKGWWFDSVDRESNWEVVLVGKAGKIIACLLRYKINNLLSVN